MLKYKIPQIVTLTLAYLYLLRWYKDLPCSKPFRQYIGDNPYSALFFLLVDTYIVLLEQLSRAFDKDFQVFTSFRR